MAGLKYTAPPTCARFMQSASFGRLILGPVGSGKTTACIMELLRRAIQQSKSQDGFRYTRFAIIRQTLDQLKKTVLKDIQLWMANIIEWKVSESTVYVTFGDVRSEWMLIPMEEEKDQQRLLSSQLTGAWISECIEIDSDLIAPISGRCGRYPSGGRGAPSWHGIICDSNFPTIGTPWQIFTETPPSEFQIFKQPGGRTPEAENLQWLWQTEETLKLPETHPDRLARGREYYAMLSGNINTDWVTRYVDAQYGADPSGSAVYKASFSRKDHIGTDIEPVASRLILVGQDFGRNPWSLICQLDHRGRLLILEEVEGTNTGLEQHIRTSLRPAIGVERYRDKPVVLIGDPSGMNKSSLFELNEFDVCKKMGFRAEPAPTNALDPRLRAVESFFMTRGGIIIDANRCPKLIEGLGGQYRFAKTKLNEPRAIPDKNAWSHVNDSLQYVALVASSPGHYGRIWGRIMHATVVRQPVPDKAWT